MLRLLYGIFLLIPFISSAQFRQGKNYFYGDTMRIKEIFYYSTQDSLLNGSYESFYLNGSLHTYGWFTENLPDSIWKYYHENGRPKAEGKYKKGVANGKWKYFYENGNIKSQGILRGSTKEGYWTFFYENGGEKSNGNYYSGKKNGIWNYFYEDESLKAQAYLENGKGRYTEFYPSGSRRMEGYNENDKCVGEWIYYFESGEVEAIGIFEDGLKTGAWTYFHKNGMIAAKGRYRRGRRTGSWIYYHQNGKVSQEGLIVNDQKEGYWKLFYPSGELKGEANFAGGTGAYNEYYPSGSRKSEGTLVNGQKDGKWSYYNENGRLEGEAVFDHGEGKYTGFYPEGNVKIIGKLKDEKRIGEWTLFNPDGSIAGTYHPIYESEKPIFKSRISEDPAYRDAFDKPKYKFKKRGFRYFEPKINEYRGVILASNPTWLIANRLPIALEYYLQERLGYELQVDIIRNPFFKRDKDIPVYNVFRRGLKIQFRQKFYRQDGLLGMVYFGHQASFKYLNHQVNHIDTTMLNAKVNNHGSLIENGFGYGIFVGNRWMRDAGNAGFTIDAFVGVSIEYRNFKKHYEPIPILDNYFEREIKSTIHFPVNFGINFGFVRPKSKSKTQ